MRDILQWIIIAVVLVLAVAAWLVIDTIHAIPAWLYGSGTIPIGFAIIFIISLL